MFNFIREHSGVLNFNKEILMGEIGAFLGVQLFACLFSRINSSPGAISFFAVLGAMLFSFLFFLLTRIYDYSLRNELTIKRTVKDVGYYAPGSFILVFLIYSPILFLVSKFLLEIGINVSLAVFLSQVIAFFYFLVSINVYRLSLRKFFKIIL